ncbi:MAG: hypothetical protein PHX14_00785 [Syntrophomonadaceae bacterium]|nr:hypothetical protein [Syntrophomonadaceae bacterium]
MMKIIDAHMHFSNITRFVNMAKSISLVNYSKEGLKREFEQSDIIMGIGMGVNESMYGMLRLLPGNEFADAYLLELQADLFKKREPASQLIKSRDKIVGAMGYKYNPIVYFFINNVFLWDFHCLFALEKWQIGRVLH